MRRMFEEIINGNCLWQISPLVDPLPYGFSLVMNIEVKLN